MEVDKILLQTMIREFWSVDNNQLCENVTILFLRKIGLNDKEITRHWLSSGYREPLKNKGFKDAEKALDNAIEETKNYFSEG